MKKVDKYYKFLSLFNDCQEKAVYAIKELTNCKFRTAKIRTIVTNIRFDGINENFSDIEPFINTIFYMVEKGYDISNFNEDKKYKDLNDSNIFTIEEIDDIGLSLFKEEMSLLSLSDKVLEYLYFRETAFKDKANKEMDKIRAMLDEAENKARNLNKEIASLKSVKTIKKPKAKKIEYKQYVLFNSKIDS